MTETEATPELERLGAAIRTGCQAMGINQRQFADLAGISRSTTIRLVGGSGPDPSQLTLARVEKALGWAPGSAQRILAGGEPQPVTVPSVPRAIGDRLEEPDVETVVQVLSNARMSVLQRAFRELGWASIHIALASSQGDGEEL